MPLPAGFEKRLWAAAQLWVSMITKFEGARITKIAERGASSSS